MKRVDRTHERMISGVTALRIHGLVSKSQSILEFMLHKKLPFFSRDLLSCFSRKFRNDHNFPIVTTLQRTNKKSGNRKPKPNVSTEHWPP